MHRLLVLAVVASCAGAHRPHAPIAPPAAWGALAPGPHAVGFHHEVVFDRTRVFGTIPDGRGAQRAETKRARPLLVGIWYPARAAGPRMRHRDYLAWPLARTEAAALAAELEAHARELLATEALGLEENQPLDAVQTRALEGLLAVETAAHRDAAPARGAFPLVVYQPGARGTVEENALLFEYLASHGYVVAAGAFLHHGGVQLGAVAERRDRDLDVHAIVEQLARRPGVDARRLAVIGFSAGAQAMLKLAAANPAIDAVISLDTTWDYARHPVRNGDDAEYKDFLERGARASTPVLAFAAKGADYAPFAGMVHALRVQVTLDDLDHDDFTWRGAGAAHLRTREPEAPAAATVRAQYDAMCRHVHAFLEVTLAGRDGALEALEPRAGVHVTRREAAPRPPTARELLELAIARGATAALERCETQRGSGGAPCDEDWAEQIGDLLLARRLTTLAVPLLAADVQRRPTAVLSALRLGDAHRMLGDRAAARAAYTEVERRVVPPQKPLKQYTFDEVMHSMWLRQARAALRELPP